MARQMENYEYFQKELPDLLADPLKLGKFVVVCDLSIKGLFDTADLAYRFATNNSYEGFVIQQIIDKSRVVEYLAAATV